MGKRNKVTTRDIAQATNVSQSTVSMILSDNKNVSFKEETVTLVKKTAKEYDCHNMFQFIQFLLFYGCFKHH